MRPSPAPGAAPGRASAARAGEPFGDRLARHVDERGSQLVLGLDPDPGRLWPSALAREDGTELPVADRAARAVARHCAEAIDAVAEHCVAVKLQLACFERLGASGWWAAGEAAAHARRSGLLVIVDAKRGDVPVTAAAYAQAFFGALDTPFGRLESLGADALTVNPLLGLDTLVPFVTAARAHGAGLFVLVRTSNPGAADFQDQPLRDGGTLSDRLAALVDTVGAEGLGHSGLSDIGAVVGATASERLAEMRARMPHAVFLLPGVGAQGGRVEDLAAAFSPGRAGGLVAVSRSLVSAHERDGGDPATAAAREAERLRRRAWELAA